MAVIQGGASTANAANVDSNYNMQVRTPVVEEQAGFAQLSSEIDAGSVSGSRFVKALEASPDYRLRVGVDTPLFNLTFEGTNIYSAVIQQTVSTMAVAQAANVLVLNSGNAVASGNVARVQSYRAFPLFGSYPLYFDAAIREAEPDASNAVSEYGFGFASGTTAPTDGVFFRRISGGQLRAVCAANSVENDVAIDVTNVPSRSGSGTYSPTETNHYAIVVSVDECLFWINDVLVARLVTPANQALPTSSSAQPLLFRVYNSGAASAARQLALGMLNVSIGDANATRSWQTVVAGLGGTALQSQPGAASVTQLANAANSAAPVSATLSNTAAGYTTLGGQLQFAAVVGAETDYALFAYQNPAASASVTGKTLFVTDIRIGELFVTGAAVGTLSIFQWAIAAGSTAVSLATADGATAASPKRMVLGSQVLAAGAAVGSMAAGFSMSFATPIPVAPGQFFHVILKNWSGTNTASLVFRGSVAINGFFE